MTTKNNTTKVKVSAASLIDSPAVSKVSVWALLYDGKEAGKILWIIGAGGQWKCAIQSWKSKLFGLDKSQSKELDYRLTPKVIGTAGGYGYDKRSASFADCLRNNGIDSSNTVDSRGSSAIQCYLSDLGFQVIEVI